MAANVYRHEFRMSARSVATWSLALALLIFAFLSLFSSVSGDAAVLNEMLQQFPEELRVAFGMEGMDLSSILGFYSIAFLFCQICLAIQGANYGFSILSVEERELTADFLLAKPVGRATILTSKVLSALTGILITNVVVWISSLVWIGVFSGGPYDRKPLLLLLASGIVFQLFFLTVGMLISLLVRRVRSVTSLSMALAFGMYVLSALGGMLGEDKLEVISPFKHFDPNFILSNAAYDMPLVLITVACTVVSVTGSYLLYTRRDIPAAV